MSGAPSSGYLFVYGTLRPGHAPPGIATHVARLREVGHASVPGRTYDLGEYPGAVLDASSGTTIAGTVLALPDDPGVLAALDAYEGFDPGSPARSLFLRVRTPVTLADGQTLECWMYVRGVPRDGPP